MDMIICHTDFLTKGDFSLLMNLWDDELMHYTHSETFCSKFMMGHIEWSPTVGLWISHWLLHRVCLWMIGDDKPDPWNMIRDCFKLNLPDPRSSTNGSICAQVIVTDQEIKRLSKDAPALQQPL
jgi:hypothetical protein